MSMHPRRTLFGSDVMDLLKILEVELSLDWDCQLICEIPEDLEYEKYQAIADFVTERHVAIVEHMKAVAENERSVFFGGSLNGQPVPFVWQIHVHNVSRATWEAYCAMSSHHRERRMIFVGEATSEAKAKELAKAEFHRRCEAVKTTK